LDKKPLLREAAEVVRSGGLVVLPTETFYALAADPFQERAVRRIFAVKGREKDKPLPLIASDRSSVERMVQPPDPLIFRLMDSFWPGSLTILLEPRSPISDLLLGPNGRIGVRVPPPCAGRTLAELSGGWITATSANLSGDPDPDEVGRIAAEVREAVDMVLDMGPSPGGRPSTLVGPAESGIVIIREGAVPRAALQEFLGT